MSDRPWLGDSDPALRLERELLKRLNAEQPPVGSVEQGWAALAAEIGGAPPVGTSAGGGTTQAAAQGAGGLAAKVAVGIALLGGGIWAAAELAKTEPPAVVVPPQRASVSAPAPQPVAPAVVPEPTLTAEPSLSSTEPPNARRTPSVTTLAEEGRMLAEAHRLVQAGQPERALSVLRDSQKRYPRSVLSQEREVLTIEALYAGGASGTAKQRALAFLARHPKSPHAERLRRFVE
jgi:TolA-binding protein